MSSYLEVESRHKRLEAKDTKQIRGQGKGLGQPFRGQALLRQRTGMLKVKDTGASVLQKKLKKIFSCDFQNKGL